MKMVPDRSGRFTERPFFDDGEIDAIMQEILYAAGNPRINDSLAVDLDTLMLRLNLEPTFSNLPKGVLGVTHFEPGGTPVISLSDDLEFSARSDTNALHRLRTTQGHELGHATLHAPLYVDVHSTSSSLGKLPSCEGSKGIDSSGYTGEWWEYQANAAMAAILMPASDFREQATTWCSENGVASIAKVRSRLRCEDFIAWIAEHFCVSKAAARIRAKVLKIIPGSHR